MKSFKLFSKQLFGVRHERITKSLLACAIVFFALYAAETRVAVSPIPLYLTATFFSFGVMWRSLGSARNAEAMMGLLMLPFDNRELVVSYLLAFSGYALITKTLLVLTFFFAVGTWSLAQVLMALLCACNACALAAAWRTLVAKKNIILVLLWGCGMALSFFFVEQLPVFFGFIFVSFMLAAAYLLSVDAYVFYRPVSAKKLMSRAKGKGNVWLYLLRYLTSNRSYLGNTLVLWGIACFLPVLLGQLDGMDAMPLGFAVLCLNTPICILLSCNPDLEQAIRALPGQAIRFGSRYCLFIFAVNMTANSIYLLSWQLQNGGVGYLKFLTAVLFALQSAILSVLLEWLRPIRNWKIENDLWHHPRKYLVPLLMMSVTVFVGAWPLFVWVWLGVMVAECFGLLLVARRI